MAVIFAAKASLRLTTDLNVHLTKKYEQWQNSLDESMHAAGQLSQISDKNLLWA